MAVNRDFRELFAALNGAGAEYVLVGGYAHAVHGVPRFTKDLDVWVHATADNAQKVWAALLEFGAPLRDLTAAELASPEVVFPLGTAPKWIDVLTSIDGVDFASAWARRVAIFRTASIGDPHDRDAAR